MCGIFGIIDKRREIDPAVIQRSCDAIAHRGPDDSGIFTDGALGLGHRRLSILDLSAAGHQPMMSQNGRYVMVFNGEIYNHRELRETYLSDITFRSTSDTETLLEGYVRHGVSFLQRLNGIFSLAIYDRSEQQLLVVRDPLGVKPLYYYQDENYFIFGSEIKSFLPVPGIDRTVSREALFDYILYLWSPGEGTPLVKVKKLLPGHLINIRTAHAGAAEIRQYYHLPLPSVTAVRSEKEAIDILEQKLLKAVERQMLSDVPLGFFLSGGLDSSLLVAMAKRLHPDTEIQTFTIRTALNDASEGFVDDLHYAKKVAEYLGVALNIVESDVHIMEQFDGMVWHLDEPQSDPSPINVINICTLARTMGYKVLVSGTGGDDLFSGYRRHTALTYESMMQAIPRPVSRWMRSAILAVPSFRPAIRRLKKMAEGLGKDAEDRIIGYFHWLPKEEVRALFRGRSMDGYDSESVMRQWFRETPEQQRLLNRELYLEQKSFLVDHNLNYTDKMSMAVGVEVRVPYLDLELIEFAASLPASVKLKDGETKYLLKKVAERYLPAEIIYRSKTGFGAPVRKWITEDLDSRLSSMFGESGNPLMNELFDPAAVHRLRNNNAAKEIDAAYSLWALLSIESWLRQFVQQSNDV